MPKKKERSTDCPGADASGASSNIDLTRYSRLHQEGARLIHSWFARAWANRDCLPQDSFEPFIFAFIAFNGWAACVTGQDTDSIWKQALMQDPQLNADFARLTVDPASQLGAAAQTFSTFWPIFSARHIRRRQINRPIGERESIINHYLAAGIKHYEPACWQRHIAEGDPVPIDWPHTLAVLYRVRCNLFHGEKSVHSEMDQHIVHAALQVLLHFLHKGNYLDHWAMRS